MNGDRKIALALSGGKDSTTAAYLLKKILGVRKDIEFSAITVDEGITGYRPRSIVLARNFCRKMRTDHHLVSFKDLIGWTMDEIAKMDKETIPCTYCGVFRRRCLNLKAKEIGADMLATGLNLDDTVQSILMNISRADLDKLARLGPHSKIQEGLVPRIQPLRTIPEKEVYLYALFNNLKIHDAICPYSERAMRGRYRSIVDVLEKYSPGTRHAILKTYDSIRPALEEIFPQANLHSCKCGEPTLGEKCQGCTLIERLESKA